MGRESQIVPEEFKTNGIIWEWLFKINQLLLPFVIAWAVWATASIFELKGFAGVGPRFTMADATNLELRVKEWTRMNYPPKELYDEIKEIRMQAQQTHQEIEEIKILLAKRDLLN